ncbi:MAG: hypothetical protein AABZ39_08235 [Spirochaetota bacterium]
MTLAHVGIVCSSEANADRFYRDLLGLAKADPKTLHRDLSKAIFSIDEELKIIHYTGNGALFEVFIYDRMGAHKPIEHICLEVEGLADLLHRGRAMGLTILEIPKGQTTLFFMSDLDGTLFELKEKKHP